MTCISRRIGAVALALALPGVAAADGRRLPAAFEPNAGQTDQSVHYSLRTQLGTFFFTASEMVLAPSPQAAPGGAPLRMRFVGANPAPVVQGGAPLTGKVNYLLGNDPERWHTGLPTYSEITYAGLYPGVVLTYSVDGRPLKGTYTVAPGTDPQSIRWRYEDGEASVDEAGHLLVRTRDGATLTEDPPVAWQEVEGGRVPVSARYAIGEDGSVGFAIGSYNPRRPLTIDPVIEYSTYLGGLMFDIAWAVAADAAGNAYIAGDTESANFPTVSPYQPGAGGQGDAFVAKFAPDGTPLYSTYLGGSYYDYATDIAVDSQGNAYVTGKTGSVNFPTKNALQPAYGGAWDAFVTKLNPTGSGLVYSTYLGGSGEENYVNAGVSGAIAVDQWGAAYVTGSTQSTNFPTVQPFQAVLKGSVDAFVSKVSPSGAALAYSTFLGGTGGETGWAVAVDRSGQAVVTGDTTSFTTFPTKNAYQPQCAPGAGGCWDVFVTRLQADGKGLVFSTYFGGNDVEWIDRGMGVALDRYGTAYVTGMTGSTNFPMKNAWQSVYGGQIDAFVTRFNRTGMLLSSTYLGGNNSDVGYAIALDRASAPVKGAHVSGVTLSPNFPVVAPLQADLGGFEDAFVAKFDLAVGNLLFSTYLGGADGREEYGATGIAVDGLGHEYVAGGTEATDFPIQNPYQPMVHGSYDVFLTRINPQP